MLVAVYGTLKKDYGNNRILSHAELIGTEVVEGYKLFYSGSEGSFPVAVPCEESKVSVEVWNIGDCEATLNALDSLEGTPWMYTRETVLTAEEPRVVSMYVGNPKCFRDLDHEVPCVRLDDGSYLYEWSR